MTETSQSVAGDDVRLSQYWDTMPAPVSEPIRIFIGHDRIEEPAYHVLCASLIRRSSAPLQITPVELRHLRNVLLRAREPKQSTEFSFSRFLVPWLCNYEGWALWMDSDMLARADITELWLHRDWRYAVQCVQHEYQPSTDTKMLGQVQTRYPMKNWSSLMLFNNRKCQGLTPRYVNSASGLDLHQFAWARDERVGPLPRAWNHLVGEQAYDPAAKLVHFTLGGPWWEGYRDVDYAAEWRGEHARIKEAKDHD